MFSFGIKNKCVKTGVATPVSETKASYTIQTALKLEAKALGTLGNAVTVKAKANSSDNLAISVTGNDITIQLANATGSKNTMTLIAAAIAASTPANALVNAIVITGATQMTAFTVQSLASGLNGSIGYLSEIRYDTDGVKWEMKYATSGCYYWSPDCFPSAGVPYVDCFDKVLQKIVYKILINDTTGTLNVLKTISTTIAATKILENNAWQTLNGNDNISIPYTPPGGSQVTSGTGVITGNALTFTNWIANASYVGKAMRITAKFVNL